MKTQKKKLTVVQAVEIMHTVGRKAKFMRWFRIVIFPIFGLPEIVAWQKMSGSYSMARERQMAFFKEASK